MTTLLKMKAVDFNVENVFHGVLNEELEWKCIFYVYWRGIAMTKGNI